MTTAFVSKGHFKIVLRNTSLEQGQKCTEENAKEFCFYRMGAGLPSHWLPYKTHKDLITVIECLAEGVYQKGQNRIKSDLRTLLGVDDEIERLADDICDVKSGMKWK